MSAANTIAILGALGGMFAVLSKQTSLLPTGGAGNTSAAKIAPQTIYALASDIASKHGLNADPLMITAMALVESGDINNPASGANRFAVRYEPHINDSSIGIMQTLTSTAKWLATDMGYKDFGVPGYTDLFDVETSIYFGVAYVDYLSNWKGKARSESFIVQSYNAGPGNSSNHHYQKYLTAKKNLKEMWGF